MLWSMLRAFLKLGMFKLKSLPSTMFSLFCVAWTVFAVVVSPCPFSTKQGAACSAASVPASSLASLAQEAAG